jgi:hypothetical protein
MLAGGATELFSRDKTPCRVTLSEGSSREVPALRWPHRQHGILLEFPVWPALRGGRQDLGGVTVAAAWGCPVVQAKEPFMKSLFVFPVVSAFAIACGVAVAAEPAKPAAETKAEAKKLVKPAGMSDRTKAMNDAGARPATRDWAAVDTNKDNLVSPDEMEAYLKANAGPAKK